MEENDRGSAQYTELLNDVRRKQSGGERSAKDCGELLVEAADSQLLEIEIRVYYRRERVFPAYISVYNSPFFLHDAKTF